MKVIAKINVFILALIAVSLCSIALNYRHSLISNSEIQSLTITEKRLSIQQLKLESRLLEYLSVEDILTRTDNQCADGDAESCSVNQVVTEYLIQAR